MNEFSQLRRPEQSPVRVDPTPKNCPSDGFNYPSFRLINKQARVTLSSIPFILNPSTAYCLFAAANSKGWFAAARKDAVSAIIFSPLHELRAAFRAARDDDEDVFRPQRAISFSLGNPNIIVFACNETRLIVGFEQGQILVYDTARLFSAGSDNVTPLHMFHTESSMPARQILPNPSSEPNLVELVVVLTADGKVQILNVQMESYGGWVAEDLDSSPVSVSWSPKGKQIAIGLQSGDILTFSLTNKSSPQKHIPPTAAAPLVSLNWPGPGHTFRTSYAPIDPNTSDPVHHIVLFDTKSSTATYLNLNHPYRLPERTVQSASTLLLPKWDQENDNSTNSLLVVGDASSVDLEVIGNIGNSWYQQSQENQLTLPLDKHQEDTILLALDIDLTVDSSSTGAGAVPIMYAHLNDGTVQGWYIDNSKPYVGMITPFAFAPDPDPGPTATPLTQMFWDASSAPAFSQQSALEPQPASTFEQPQFGRPSAFGQLSQNTSLSGQTSPPPVFGQPSPFGQHASASGFGQQQSPSGPGFSQRMQSAPTTSGFGSTSPLKKPMTSSAFGSSGGAFSAYGSVAPTNAFSQSSLSTSEFPSPASASAAVATNPALEPEVSMMSDSGPSFGGLSLGGGSDSDSKPKNAFGGGIFGVPSPPPLPLPPGHPASQPSSVFGSSAGGVIKPATGFGAFGNNQPQNQMSMGDGSGPAEPTMTGSEPATAFGAKSSPGSAFGQPSFGQTGFAAKPAFGHPAFGQSAFGKLGPLAPIPAAASSGGFGAFASSGPTTFGLALQQTGASGGEAKPAWSGGNGDSTFSRGSGPIKDGLVPDGGVGSIFGGCGSVFGNNVASPIPTPVKSTPSTSVPNMGDSSPESTGAGRSPSPFANNDSSPAPPPFRSHNTTPTTGTFGNLRVSSSGFKPAIGFGAFGSDPTLTSSPFFKTSTEPKTPTVSAFGNLGSSTPPPVVAARVPTFGATSVLGSVKSAFASTTPPPPNPTRVTPAGFGAFTGSSTTLSAFTGTTKSFGELLKAGDSDAKDPVKLRTSVFQTAPPQPASVEPTPTGAAEKSENKPGALVSVFGLTSATKSTLPLSLPEPPAQQKQDIPTVGSVPPKQEIPEPSTPSTPTSYGSTQVPVFTLPLSKDVTPTPESVLPKTDKWKASHSDEHGEQTLPGKDLLSFASVSDDPSYGPLSLSSQTSSFVEVSNPDGDGGALSFFSDGDADGELDNEDALEEEDDTRSFLSGSFGSEASEGLPDDETSGDEADSSASASPEASNIPLPPSRSPSTTPQAEVRSLQVTSSPPSFDVSESSKSSPLSTIPEESTTPPGSPGRETATLSKTCIPTQTPVVSATAPLTFGLGIGRPSTRPARSSPLASAPVSGDDGDDEDGNDGDETVIAKTSPSLKPHPASPKPRFRVLPTQLRTEPLEEYPSGRKLARPKTPPLLSSFGTKTPATRSPSNLAPFITSAPPKSPTTAHSTPPNLFGTIPSLSTTSTTAEPFGNNVLTPATPSSMGNKSMTPPTFGLFGSKPAAPEAPRAMLGLNLSPFSANTLASSALAPPTPGNLFGGNVPSPSPASSKPRTPPLSVLAPPPPPSLEVGMQAECAYLFEGLAKELDDLRLLAQEASRKRVDLSQSAGGSRRKADLGDSTKWGLNDIIQFGQTMKQFEQDITQLQEQRNVQRQALRELRSKLLKAGTRREEIVRFNKAKTDTDFARMLKARTLGPEHLETQTQLRRNIRGMRDRVQKLEDHLQSSKKKLSQMNAGKSGLRAPSLDTINRTYRNIDIAIQQQVDDVTNLTSRLAKLNVTTPLHIPTTDRDTRLPDGVLKRPFNITPHVAVTTAAALNAERSAQKLKRALLTIRKEPLLNTKAASAPAAPVAFNTHQKASIASPTPRGLGFNIPFPGTSFGSDPFALDSIPEMPLPNWDLPDDNFNPPPPSSSGRRGAGMGSKRQRSVPMPMKKSPGQVWQSPPDTTFDWGPLPNFNPQPVPTMATKSKTVSPENSLGG